jgi:hypothetical protein
MNQLHAEASTFDHDAEEVKRQLSKNVERVVVASKQIQIRRLLSSYTSSIRYVMDQQACR